MTPFQEFRLWARRAPNGERAVGAVAFVVVMALVVWLAIPGSTKSTSLASVGAGASAAPGAGGVAPGGGTGGPASTIAPGGAGIPSGGGAAPVAATGGGGSSTSPTVGGGGVVSPAGTGGSGGTGGITSPTPAACPNPPSGTPGVTSKQVKVAITLTNVIGGAGNALFGIAPPAQQQQWFEAAVAGINATGGIACRTLVAQYYDADPSDQSGLQSLCLTIAQAGVFAEVDSGGYVQYSANDCFAQHHIPYFGAYLLPESQRAKFYPYLFDFETLDGLYHNTVFALRDRGFFSAANGFKKLGYIYRDCNPEIVGEMRSWIHQAGVSGPQLVEYDVGCPALFASTGDIQNAVVKFQTSGVTNVIDSQFLGDFPNFTNMAQQQGFKPKYGLPDDAMISIAYGSMHPNYGNILNAISITESRNGEERTPGFAPTAATAKCNSFLKKYGTTYQLPALAGNTCDQLWMLVAAADHAPSLAQNQMAIGLQRAQSVDFSFPEAPNDFTANGVTTGGEFWRSDQFMQSCNCWQVIDKTFHPSYP